MNKLCWLLIFLAVILFFAPIIPSDFINVENYTNLDNNNMGKYPKSVTYPILKDSFPLKTPPSLSTADADVMYARYPSDCGGSYKQQTNNRRYWPWPNNGSCTPGSFCGSMYEMKKIVAPPPPTQPSWNSDKTRVNFYDSCY